jgi:hypothetical protein
MWRLSSLLAGCSSLWLAGHLNARSAEQPALQLPQLEGSAHGFPSLPDLDGRKLADGEFSQWIDQDWLRIKITYDFGNGHRVEENARFQRAPRLVQKEWSWRESDQGAVAREFSVDFSSGTATALKRERGELRRWTKQLKIEAGRTFAGFGFTLAIECLRQELLTGTSRELRAIGFTPTPHIATVAVSFAGSDHLAMGGRSIDGDQFLIHPQIPRIARIFVRAPDTRIWLIHAPPVGFLRWQGPFAEMSDPMIQVDLLPTDAKSPERSGDGGRVSRTLD